MRRRIYPKMALPPDPDRGEECSPPFRGTESSEVAPCPILVRIFPPPSSPRSLVIASGLVRGQARLAVRRAAALPASLRPTTASPPRSCTRCWSARSRCSGASRHRPRAPTSRRRRTRATRHLRAARPRSRSRRARAGWRSRRRASGASSTRRAERPKQLVATLAAAGGTGSLEALGTADLKAELERVFADNAAQGAPLGDAFLQPQPAARARAGQGGDAEGDRARSRSLTRTCRRRITPSRSPRSTPASPT